MVRGGYFHGDEYMPYKDGNLTRSSSSRSYSKKTVHNSGTYNKSRNNKSSYSNTYEQGYSKTYYQPFHSKTKRQHRKRQSYNVISVEEANRRLKQNKSTQSSSSSEDNLIVALLCICGILAFGICCALNSPIGFFPILIGLWGIVYVIFWIVEELPKKIKKTPPKNKKIEKHNNNSKLKKCPKCNMSVSRIVKRCPHCYYKF